MNLFALFPWWLWFLIAFCIVAGVIIEIRKGRLPKILPYKKKENLLSQNELKFYTALLEATKNKKTAIFSKVRIADIIETKFNQQRFLNMITSKHIDFVICNPETSKILCAIEVDDSSHAIEARKKRDDFVNQALKDAGCHLIRFKAKASYNAEEINKDILKYI